MDNKYSSQMLFYVSCNVYLAEEKNPTQILCCKKLIIIQFMYYITFISITFSTNWHL